MVQNDVFSCNYGGKISYFTPKTMSLRDILKNWLNNNLGDGFRFKYDDVEFIIEENKIKSVIKFADDDYNDLFGYISTDNLDDEVEITNYSYRITMDYDKDYRYNSQIYNYSREARCCPVCSGRGFVSNGFYSSTGNTWVSSTTAPDKCRSCQGKGYIEI